MAHRYHTLPRAPDHITAANVIARILAGIGFRFYWVTDALTQKTYEFQPGPDARSILETVDHIWELLNWLYRAMDAKGTPKPAGALPLREATLDLIARLEEAFSEMEQEELAAIQVLKEPFWPVLNGPLSDVLTHIGQIAMMRRMAGSPVALSNPFEGTPPPGS